MLHECVWPLLIGWGLLRRCFCSLGLSAVGTQIMPHLVSKGRHCAGTKGSPNTLLEQKVFWKASVQSGKMAVSQLTGHFTVAICFSWGLISYVIKSVEILAWRCVVPPVTLCGFIQQRFLPSDNHWDSQTPVRPGWQSVQSSGLIRFSSQPDKPVVYLRLPEKEREETHFPKWLHRSWIWLMVIWIRIPREQQRKKRNAGFPCTALQFC